METTALQTFYPDFVPNQVLTSTQLNQLRTYLDEQTRLSRLRLVGRGIVCGLTWAWDEPAQTVTIAEGYGITSEGYLLQLEETHYTAVHDYGDPHVDDDGNPQYEPWQELDGTQRIILELVDEATLAGEEPPDDARTVEAADFVDRVLVLYMEIEEVDLKSCLVTSCDNKGLNVEFVVKALLVKKDDLDSWSTCTSPSEAVLMVPRLHTELGVLKDVTTASEINAAYGSIVKTMRDGLADAINGASVQYGTFLDLDEERKDTAVSALQSLLSDIGDFDQYHYDFVKDLACAYNEFIACACELITDCCPNGAFPRHLMLGDLDETEGYRHVFAPSPVRNVMHSDLEKVRKLFERLLLLIETFDHDADDGIRITTSHTELRSLGERAVPYYYGEEDDIHKRWQPEMCCTVDPLWSYHLDPGAALDIDYGTYSFMRIEGHLDRACSVAKQDIEDWRTTHNLEFDLLCLHMAAGSGDDASLPATVLTKLNEIDDFLLSPPRLRQILDLIDLAPLSDEPVGDFRRDLQTLKQELYTLPEYTGWIDARCAQAVRCDVSHLQADYLVLRSEMLSFYKRIFKFLSDLEKFLGTVADLFPVEDLSDGNSQIPATEFALRLAYGIHVEIALLRDIVHELIHYLLPKDLKCFDFHLFLRRHQDLQQALLELRLIPVFIVWYAVANGNRDGLPLPVIDDSEVEVNLDDGGNESLIEQLVRLAETRDTLTVDQEIGDLFTLALRVLGAMPAMVKLFDVNHLYVLQAGFGTVYYALEAHREESHFGTFAERHNGLEHLAGVEKGGTFVLVCEENPESGDSEVVADFTLGGKTGCCCTFDPDALCLPPIAMMDYHFVVRPEPTQEGQNAAEVDIDVLWNDFGLNDVATRPYANAYDANLTIELPETDTPQGGNVEIVDAALGIVRYTHDDPNFFGLDSFRYVVVDETCDADDPARSAPGRAVVVVVPGFTVTEDRGDQTGFGMIEGRVTDRGGNPLPGVNIVVEGTARGAVTNADGNFRIIDLTPDTYVLVVSFAGFQTQTSTIELEAGETERVTIVLGQGGDLGGFGTFVLDDAPIVTLLADEASITREEAVARVNETVGARFASSLGEMEAMKAEDPPVARSGGFKKTERFLSTTVPDPSLAAEALDEEYDKLADSLSRAISRANDDRKPVYTRMLEIASEAYLDRLVLNNPTDLGGEGEARVAAVRTNLEKAEVEPSSFRSSWSGRGLSSKLGTTSVNRVNRLLR